MSITGESLKVEESKSLQVCRGNPLWLPFLQTIRRRLASIGVGERDLFLHVKKAKRTRTFSFLPTE